jgi:hypothetical protein
MPSSQYFGIVAIKELLASNTLNFNVTPVDEQDELLATAHDQVPEGLDTTAHGSPGDRVQVEVQTIGGRGHDGARGGHGVGRQAGGDDDAQVVQVQQGADDAQEGARPVRRRRPDVKYSAAEYDLSTVKKRSRRTIRKAL